MLRCHACGEENDDGALMCSLCKAVFRKNEASTAPPAPRPTAKKTGPQGLTPAARRIALGVGALVVGLAIYGSSIVKQNRRARIEQQRRDLMPKARLAEGGDNLKRFRYPAPPEALPMVGPEGQDEFDYPRKTADPLGFLSLLHHRQFNSATNYIEELQNAFEKDPRNEDWPHDALGAFATADPRLLPLLKEWVQHNPHSFVPHAALGIYWNAEAWAHRGTDYASKTSGVQFRDMAGADLEAMTHLKKALEIRGAANVVRYYMLRILAAHGARKELQEGLDETLALCPGCFRVRALRMNYLAPRWGGSIEEMTAFAALSVKQHANRKLRLLAGYTDIETCNDERSAQRYQTAREACDRAVALGEYWLFLSERAFVHENEHNDNAALADLSRAIELRPSDADLRARRASTYLRLGRFEKAEADLSHATLLDPADRGLDWHVNEVARHRLNAGEEALFRWQFAVARTHLHRVLWWTPDSKPARQLMTELDDIQTRVEAVRRQPNNFELHMALVDHLAAQQRFDEVVLMWTGFLRDNPGHPRAYMERAGAHANMRRFSQARDDFEKACTGGWQAACSHVDAMRARM